MDALQFYEKGIMMARLHSFPRYDGECSLCCRNAVHDGRPGRPGLKLYKTTIKNRTLFLCGSCLSIAGIYGVTIRKGVNDARFYLRNPDDELRLAKFLVKRMERRVMGSAA